MRVFLVDVISLSRTNCAQPLDYYANMMVVLVGLKLALVVLLLGPKLWHVLKQRRCGFAQRVVMASVRRKMDRVENELKAAGSRRATIALALSKVLRVVTLDTSVNWAGVFKASFMLLFVAYPGVSLKILRMFKCRHIDDEWWLAADMRLRCYDGRWAGYALYAVGMALVYVVGLPVLVLWILFKRRRALFVTHGGRGASADVTAQAAATRTTYGFLYEAYGPGAWWWEVEELVRKLLLSAVVVLIEDGSPLQVTLAVLVSGWAHVLHGVYRPWGAGSMLYRMQHGSLFTTSFVFLMGLLFKVEGVSTHSRTYSALSVIMLLICVVFMATWCVMVALRMREMWRYRRSDGSSASTSLSSELLMNSTLALRSAASAKRVDGAMEKAQGEGAASEGVGRGVDDGVAEDKKATQHGVLLAPVEVPARLQKRLSADTPFVILNPFFSSKGAALKASPMRQRHSIRGVAMAAAAVASPRRASTQAPGAAVTDGGDVGVRGSIGGDSGSVGSDAPSSPRQASDAADAAVRHNASPGAAHPLRRVSERAVAALSAAALNSTSSGGSSVLRAQSKRTSRVGYLSRRLGGGTATAANARASVVAVGAAAGAQVFVRTSRGDSVSATAPATVEEDDSGSDGTSSSGDDRVAGNGRV